MDLERLLGGPLDHQGTMWSCFSEDSNQHGGKNFTQYDFLGGGARKVTN